MADEEEINSTIALNFTHQAAGYFILAELDSKYVEGNKQLNTCKPKDVRLDSKWWGSDNEKKLNQEFTILTEEDCRESFPKGTLSRERDIVIYTTPQLDETDNKFKSTKLFQLLKPKTDMIESQGIIIRSMKERAKEVEQKVTEVLALGLSEQAMIKLKQGLEALQTLTKQEEDKKPIDE